MDILQNIPKNRLEEIINFAYVYFEIHMEQSDFHEYLKETTNLEKSLMLINDENELVGLYLLGDNQIPHNDFSEMKGIEGVLLVIDDKYRGMGWGDKLKEYPKTMGYDYIWGQQLKTLNNLQDWLKRRELIITTPYVYITAEIY